jgi:hypothetical protein
MEWQSPKPSKGRHVDAAGARGRSLVLFGEISTGVARCAATTTVFAAWGATAAAAKPSSAEEKSAEAVVPAGIDRCREGPNTKPSARTFVLVAVVLTAANPFVGLGARVRG